MNTLTGAVRNITNIFPLLKESTQFLMSKGVSSPRENAEQLLGHVLQIQRAALYLNDRLVTETELATFINYLQRRAAREPLQYIVGHTEFMSLPFFLNENVLIPRPETEVLVERTIEMCKSKFKSKRNIKILEIGTGSGCIAVSLAAYLKNAKIVALDVSDRALSVARRNAKLNGFERKIDFKHFDFRDDSLLDVFTSDFNVLISNPPYVSLRDFSSLPNEIKDFEPDCALHDGANGLTFYSRIAGVARQLIAANGFVSVEIGFGQAEKVKGFFVKNKFSQVHTYQDLNGIDRVVVCEP